MPVEQKVQLVVTVVTGDLCTVGDCVVRLPSRCSWW